MFKINLFSSEKIKKQITPKSKKQEINLECEDEEKCPQKVSGDLALAYLGLSQTTKMSREQVEKEIKKIKDNFHNEPYVSSDTMKTILDNIDYNNAKEHINTIKFLALNNFPEYYLSKVAYNGYFSSDNGLKAIDCAKKTFSLTTKGNMLSDFNQSIYNLSVDNWETFNKRGIINLRKNLDDVKELVNLSDIEFDRTIKSPLFQNGLNYVSDNEDLNKIFAKIHSKKHFSVNMYKKAENFIKESVSEEEQKQFLSTLLENCENEYFVTAMFDELQNNNATAEHFKFLLENEKELHELFHSKINNFNDNDFITNFSKISRKINKTNINAVKNLLDIGVSQFYLSNFVNMAQDDKTIAKLNEITNKIKNGELTKEFLIPYKNAELNSKTVNANKDYKEFSTFDSDKILSSTEQGEVCFSGNDTYINHNGKLEKLNLSAKTYKKLFPSQQASLSMRQNFEIKDCYFISSTLYLINKNKDYKYHLLKLIKEKDNDIIVTFPGLKNTSVTFKNGEISPDLPHIDSCLGNQILEEAYLKAKSKATNTDLKNTYFTGGKEYITFKEIIPNVSSKECITDKNYVEKFQKVYSETEKLKLLSEIAENQNILACTSTKPQEAGELPEFGISPKHSYAIDSVDLKNKTITLVNPNNTNYTTTLSYEQFFDKFFTINICKY